MIERMQIEDMAEIHRIVSFVSRRIERHCRLTWNYYLSYSLLITRSQDRVLIAQRASTRADH